MYHTNRGEIIGTILEEKWEKTQSRVMELAKMAEGVAAVEDHESEVVKVLQQRLLEIQGFLKYVVWTYAWLIPYMKGLHSTVDVWRCD